MDANEDVERESAATPISYEPPAVLERDVIDARLSPSFGNC